MPADSARPRSVPAIANATIIHRRSSPPAERRCVDRNADTGAKDVEHLLMDAAGYALEQEEPSRRYVDAAFAVDAALRGVPFEDLAGLPALRRSRATQRNAQLHPNRFTFESPPP